MDASQQPHPCTTRILIIDDDVAICTALGKFLRSQGFEVITATDGKSGLTAALNRPDLIICDLTMPEMNGHGVLVTLRNDKRLEDIPFIFFSGSTDRNQVRQSMNLGGDDFIPKPAELSEILETVKSRLARQARQQERTAEKLKKAVEIFSGIVNDWGTPDAAIHWLAEAAINQQTAEGKKPAASIDVSPEASLPAKSENPTSFLATKDNRKYFVKLSEIKALIADGEYSRAYWDKDQNMMFRKPLKQWEQELPQNRFIRIHRKAIINLTFLDFVDKAPNGQPQVHLKDFTEVLEVSQRKVPALNKILNAKKTTG